MTEKGTQAEFIDSGKLIEIWFILSITKTCKIYSNKENFCNS